ncbi:XAC0095 family protein [[Pseudomonas] boreopolis]|uniref:XAC0095 family protein n=1 Tax=Xanthomonas boreopolis TaxID=86183 RepID=UPI003D54E706
MSKHALDDFEMGMPGYFLPEESRHRLVSLSEHIKFLSRLAQPRIADEEKEWAPEVRMGQLAFCLELLADQVDLVLDEVSWPALRAEDDDAAERDAAAQEDDAGEEGGGGVSEASEVQEAPEAPNAPGAPEVDLRDFTYGLKLEQIDRLNLLLSAISAHADVVVASSMADFAENTLSAVGDTIFEAAAEVREILEDVNDQRLWYGDRPRFGVSEGRAVYAAPRAEPSYGELLH